MPTSPAPDALLAGATGLIGRELAAQWDEPGTLHLLVRRAMPAPGPHTSVHVVDFGALPTLPSARDAFCALGTTIRLAGSREAFRAVDLDAVLAFARAAREAGVQRFGVVSALGADAKSGTFYNRVKGEMEAALATLGFATLVIARPSLLAGDRASLGQPTRPAERLSLALLRPVSSLVPLAWRPIQAAVVARALRRVMAQATPGTTILESADLQRLGRSRTATVR
jgi:uncharacterized protein YbjT (DUF2867 family)